MYEVQRDRPLASAALCVADMFTSLMRPRLARTLSTRASAIYIDPANAHVPALTSTPSGLTQRQRVVLDSALRVDQAGEIAANYIYKGQMAVLGQDPTVGSLIQVRVARYHSFVLNRPSFVQEMWDQEKRHLLVMDKLQVQHQVRPTVLSGVAKAAGYGLGVVTALLGKEAAMACTEAVETVIGEHYDEYVSIHVPLPNSRPPQVNFKTLSPYRHRTPVCRCCETSSKNCETMSSNTSIPQSNIIHNGHQLTHS